MWEFSLKVLKDLGKAMKNAVGNIQELTHTGQLKTPLSVLPPF